VAAVHHNSPSLRRVSRRSGATRRLDGCLPPIRSFAALLELFAAGVLYYWIGPTEIGLVVRPSLWIVDGLAAGQLHREDGPAVEWPTGERYYFWRGIEVPDWIIEHPDRITPAVIEAEPNVELRRCMVERLGFEGLLRAFGSTLVAEDQYGKLWRANFEGRRRTFLEVQNGTREPGGSYRKYFLSVPPSMLSPRQAAAWTYGLSPEQYEIAVRT
jgi:hypothetical protein